MAVMAQAAARYSWDNKFALFRTLLDGVVDQCASEVQGRWTSDRRTIESTVTLDVYDAFKGAVTDTATFVGAVRDKDTPDSLARAVDMTMVLDKAGGYLRTISVKSKAAFKPAPVAKVERMTQIQSYEPIAPGGPALLRKAESSAAGEAMFKKFDQHVTMEYRDFERVAPDQVAAGK